MSSAASLALSHESLALPLAWSSFPSASRSGSSVTRPSISLALPLILSSSPTSNLLLSRELGGRAAAPSAHEHAVDDEQDDRPDDGRQPAREIPELVERVGVEQRSGERTAEQRADDTDDRGHDEPARVVARQQRLGDGPGD